ncbi:MAG: hypothetical protein ACJAYB_002095 [Psychromonas sp.]|jgi:hypothetical protein
MHRSVDVIGGVDFLCTVRSMSFVGWILCIVNVNRCAERTLGVCYRWGGFLMHRLVDVIGGVDF